ncbi:MFS transporter [Actinomadura spongiicola]|uniref:MFS transporter n=1 Tax=Actinomadura spongiicola TaxID=2303421 RepID=UPI0018F26688|nr:MFS transporter [Actinomadura spongiicola]
MAPSRRGSGWLPCLLLATFVIGTDDFVIAGVLPVIAADLRVSEAAAGQLVTGFSVTYAVAAPAMALLTARLPRKALLVGGLAAFAAANLATALAPNYATLMGARVLTALIGATLTPAAFAVAERLSAPERAGRAIGMVAAGLTLSLFVGVPVGTLLGENLGWRSTFVAVGVFTCLVVAAGSVLLPRVPGAVPLGMGGRLRNLGRPAVLLCAAGTVVAAGSGLMTYTYIAPLTEDLTGRGGGILALFIAVVGVAGAAGTVAGGLLTDRWGPDRTLLASVAGVVAATAVLAALGTGGPETAPVWPVALTLALWGFSAWSFTPPMNTRIMRLAGEAGTEAVALNTSGLYVGIAMAGAAGGAVLAAYDGTGVAVAATAVGVVAYTVLAASVRRFPVRDERPTSTGRKGNTHVRA